MSCSPFDLRDYLFDELPAPARAQVRAHLEACEPCSTELASLHLTRTALMSIPDEEIPQRIAFVSDKVFEPSPMRRWFDGLWNSAARLGFVSAALVSAALLVHALVPARVPGTPSITQAEVDSRIQTAVERASQATESRVKAQMDARIATAVAQAVSETDIRAQKRTTDLLAAAEKRHASELFALQVGYKESYDYLRSKLNVRTLAANYPPYGGGAQ